MSNLKRMFVVFGGLSFVIALMGAMTGAKTQGQAGNQQPLKVNVVNSPNVNVSDLYPNQPYQKELIISGAETEVCTSIPADKNLIIELVTAHASGLTDELTHFILGMKTIAGGLPPVSHRIALQEQPDGANITTLVATQSLRAYADSGTDLCFRALDFDAGPITTRISVSGQLVNAP